MQYTQHNLEPWKCTQTRVECQCGTLIPNELVKKKERYGRSRSTIRSCPTHFLQLPHKFETNDSKISKTLFLLALLHEITSMRQVNMALNEYFLLIPVRVLVYNIYSSSTQLSVDRSVNTRI